MPDPNTLLRLRDVIARVAISRTRVYELIARGEFPAPYKIGTKSARWKASEIDAWIEALGAPSGREAA